MILRSSVSYYIIFNTKFTYSSRFFIGKRLHRFKHLSKELMCLMYKNPQNNMQG